MTNLYCTMDLCHIWWNKWKMEGGEVSFMRGASESCIPEFLTDIPHINETFHRSSITTESSGVPPYCQPLNSSHQLQADITHVGNTGKNTHHNSSVKVPEYPWMKEKKPSRKATPLALPSTPVGEYCLLNVKFREVLRGVWDVFFICECVKYMWVEVIHLIV